MKMKHTLQWGLRDEEHTSPGGRLLMRPLHLMRGFDNDPLRRHKYTGPAATPRPRYDDMVSWSSQGTIKD